MPVDFAIDFVTGDLVLSPSGDAELRSGIGVIEQSIRSRLRIARMKWPLDPTDGTLGSGLYDVFRLPTDMAITTVPLLVREALEPMREILVMDVQAAVNKDEIKQIDISLTYKLVNADVNQVPVTTLLSIAG